MREIRKTYCRLCHCACPIEAEVEGGRVVRVRGARDNDLYRGYTCAKGRAYPAMHADPGRLIESRKRGRDGGYEPISIESALDEIAARIERIVADHGPRSVALYLGTQCAAHPATGPLALAWHAAIGSAMNFSALTIDQPGKLVAQALHGIWKAPGQCFDRPGMILLVGANPLVANHMGLPCANPGLWLKRQRARGCRLVVVDPRETETARLADVHVRVRPGCDSLLLAAILRVLFEEERVDRDFLEAEVEGVEALREAVMPFEIDAVADVCGVEPEALRSVARAWGEAERGYAVVGTGPNMNGPGSTLLEYLTLCLMTVCGRWLRAGERVLNPGALVRPLDYKAQASPRRPAYGFGEPLRVRGLKNTVAGLSTAALAEEMILEGEGRVRALISVGGNPVNAWPDQTKTLAALEAAELVVQIDNRMSETARRADYVLATRMPFEMAGMTQLVDHQSVLQTGYGFPAPWAAVTPAIAEPPAGADLVEDWEIFYGLAKRMGVSPALGQGVLDLNERPTSETLFRHLTTGSRIPFDDVAAVEGGGVFEGEPVVVAPKDPRCDARLDVGNAEMMADLATLGRERLAEASGVEPRGFRLVSRRMADVYNSTGTHLAADVAGCSYNPAFVSPEDAEALGLRPGDEITIVSDHGRTPAIVAFDRGLRRGVVSMSHGWGGSPDRDGEVAEIGGNTNRLASTTDAWDRYSGMPVMSNLPVDILT